MAQKLAQGLTLFVQCLFINIALIVGPAAACVTLDSKIEDPRLFVQQYYSCSSLQPLDSLPLSDEFRFDLQQAMNQGILDVSFVIQGNDYSISQLTVIPTYLSQYRNGIVTEIRATFRNFGEFQMVAWHFRAPFETDEWEIVDIEGLMPAQYSAREWLTQER